MKNLANNQKGFTLIELVLIITCIGIMAVSVSAMDNGNLVPISLEAAAKKVKADIRYAQNLAALTESSHGFLVNGDTTYYIYNVSSGTVVNSPLTNSPMNEDLDEDFSNVVFNSNSYHIIFDSMGRPTTGGGSTIQLNSASSSKQIQITATSGFVNIL